MALYSFDNRIPQIGKDSYVSETAIVVGDVRIGDQCYIGHGAILRGDYGTIVIGNGTAIEEGAVIHSGPDETCNIGKSVTVGHGAVIHASSIGDEAVIGMGAVVSIRAEVGARTIVGEGGVIRKEKSVPGGVVVAGNPSRVIKDVTPENTEYWRWGKQLYVDLAKKYLAIGMQRID